MATPPSSSVRWLSYFSDNGTLLDVEESPAGMAWPGQQNGTAQEYSADAAGRVEETEDSQRDGSKKRPREDPGKETACSKANREKMRRDRLNDRFVDLSRALEAGKPPKTDKATILNDAVRVITQLRQEAVVLKEGNAQLKEQIKELKAEKNELRDEKARLKAEKERLEQQLKAVSYQPAPFVPHQAAMQAAAAAFVAQAQAPTTGIPAKLAPVPAAVPPVAMWQWLPPASIDTSQDHVLRPPVA